VNFGEVTKTFAVSCFCDNDGAELEVKFVLESQIDASTLVNIQEGSMEDNDRGINWLKGNTFGWSNFSACLKAYLEYNINLRKGAFDYTRK
jgi:hypothetical protein